MQANEFEDDNDTEDREEEWAARYPSPLPGPGDTIFVRDTDPERKFLQQNMSAPHIDGYKWAAVFSAATSRACVLKAAACARPRITPDL